jgi:hypothetical protein
MRAALAHALVLFLPAMASAQGLTNGQVYDFDIGDVFQTTDYWCAGGCFSCPPFLYVRDSIIDKQFSTGGYDVLYTIHQQRYRGPGGPFPAEDTTLVIDFGVADTTAYPEHWCASCPGDCVGIFLSHDTLIPLASACGLMSWREDRFPCDTCYCPAPPYTWSSTFIEGCGGPYHGMGAFDPNYVCSGVSLSYYNKGGVECGNEVAMGAATLESQPLDLRYDATTGAWWLYPPSGNSALDVQLLDALGRLVRSQRITGPGAGVLLHTEGLVAGSYVVRLLLSDGTTVGRMSITR